MSIKSSLIATGLLCFAVIFIQADKQNTSKFTRFVCIIYDKELLPNATCGTRLVSRNTTLLNLDLFIKKQVNAIMLDLKLYKKFNVVYKPFLVNVRENLCDYFTKKSSVPYTSILMDIIAAYTNLNHSCPYIGNVLLRNTPMNAAKLRDLWPAGEYRADIIMSMNSLPSPVGLLQIYVEFTEKLITKNVF